MHIDEFLGKDLHGILYNTNNLFHKGLYKNPILNVVQAWPTAFYLKWNNFEDHMCRLCMCWLNTTALENSIQCSKFLDTMKNSFRDLFSE